jgi:hypothetical protein
MNRQVRSVGGGSCDFMGVDGFAQHDWAAGGLGRVGFGNGMADFRSEAAFPNAGFREKVLYVGADSFVKGF